MSNAWRARATVAVLLAGSVLAFGAVPSRAVADEAGSTPPSAPAPTAKNLDEQVAVVEGKIVTRRMLMHEVGERATDQDEREYENRLTMALLRMAEIQIFVKAAERYGITLTNDQIDDYVADQGKRIVNEAKDQAEKAKRGSGAGITLKGLLTEKGRTMEEFRAEWADRAILGFYFRVLIKGIAGKRAVVDLEPSPDDVHRLYAAHKSEFDLKPGARFAVWSVFPFEFLSDGTATTLEQAQALASARAQAMLGDFAKDRDAERIATAYHVRHGAWLASGPGEFGVHDTDTKSIVLEHATLRNEGVAEWLFEPGRRAGDTSIIDGPHGEFYAVAVLEVRPAKTRTFEEVQEALIDRIRYVRERRFQVQHTLELLARAQIWPSRLAQALEDRERGTLQKLEENPVDRDIRLR